MPSESQLQRDLQDAMRARDRLRIDVLRGVIAALKNTKVDKQLQELPEADIAAVLRKEANKRVEIADFGRRGGRPEAVAQADAEKAILESYLPMQLDSAALDAAIRAIATALGTTQIGPIMAELRSRHAGQFDGKLASELIRNLESSRKA